MVLSMKSITLSEKDKKTTDFTEPHVNSQTNNMKRAFPEEPGQDGTSTPDIKRKRDIPSDNHQIQEPTVSSQKCKKGHDAQRFMDENSERTSQVRKRKMTDKKKVSTCIRI